MIEYIVYQPRLTRTKAPNSILRLRHMAAPSLGCIRHFSNFAQQTKSNMDRTKHQSTSQRRQQTYTTTLPAPSNIYHLPITSPPHTPFSKKKKKKDARPNLHPHLRKRPGHNRHHMLVRPADPSSRPQLPHQVHRGSPRDHDVPVGFVRGSLWGVCHRAGVQYSDPSAAAVLLSAVFDELGAVFAVWAVSSCFLQSRSPNGYFAVDLVVGFVGYMIWLLGEERRTGL